MTMKATFPWLPYITAFKRSHIIRVLFDVFSGWIKGNSKNAKYIKEDQEVSLPVASHSTVASTKLSHKKAPDSHYLFRYTKRSVPPFQPYIDQALSR